ncbi:hypothetical protein N0V90_010105 [Kalmusia sp. IMI 367209]|nr:hypothetical protein N0V90_010105 [Kalmusia sp. IMI 367209]
MASFSSIRIGLNLAPATASWTVPFAAYYLFLQNRIVYQRLITKTYMGDSTDASKGTKDPLYVASRAQQNFNENIPLALVIAGLAELNGANRTYINYFLGAMLALRISHVELGLLFNAMVGSLGTLGIATLFQINLVPASKLVELKYIPVKSTIEALESLHRFSQDVEIDFAEVLIYGPEAQSYGVVAIGKLSTIEEHPKASFSGPSDDWYYQHVLEAGPKTESVSIMDYLFRHDRESFCLGQYCFERMPLNDWTRWVTDTATRSNVLAQSMQALHWSDHLFVQDLVVPQETISKMLEFLENNLKIYPLLFYPVSQQSEERSDKSNGLVMRPNPKGTSLSMNISIRGYTRSTISNLASFKEKHRQMERLLYQLGGFKWLYSRNYYTEEEFWKIYPKEKYEQLRSKCKAEYLQNIWEKSEAPKRKLITPKPKGFWDRVFARTSVVAVKHAQDRL